MLGKMPKVCSKKSKLKTVNESDFDEFLSRINKTLYYGETVVDNEHLSYPVIELAAEIYSDLKTGKTLDRLYLSEATEITNGIQINPCYIVIALLYIERLKNCNNSEQYLENIVPSQLFLISLVLASKFLDDTELCLSYFDKFKDWSKNDIFKIELDFLNAIDWNVNVTDEQFNNKLLDLEKILALKYISKRNWLTYTEMITLMDENILQQLSKFLMTVSAVCLTTYTAGILTVLASTLLASQVSSSAALAIITTTARLTFLNPLTSSSSTAQTTTNTFPSINNEILETGLNEEIENQLQSIILNENIYSHYYINSIINDINEKIIYNLDENILKYKHDDYLFYTKTIQEQQHETQLHHHHHRQQETQQHHQQQHETQQQQQQHGKQNINSIRFIPSYENDNINFNNLYDYNNFDNERNNYLKFSLFDYFPCLKHISNNKNNNNNIKTLESYNNITNHQNICNNSLNYYYNTDLYNNKLIF